MKTILILLSSTISTVNAVGNTFRTVNDDRCNPGLKLWKHDGELSASDFVHDYYGDMETSTKRQKYEDNRVVWDNMVDEFDGFETACGKANDAINEIVKELKDPISYKNVWLERPEDWAFKVKIKLGNAGCAVSETDKNFIKFLETLNYPHIQRLRMQRAEQNVVVYEDKIAQHLEKWAEYRVNLVTDMRSIGEGITHDIHLSKELIGESKLDSAFVLLTGDASDSAYGKINGAIGEIQEYGEKFETLAHYLKRDGLRWSKLNQISNEYERLHAMTEIVKLKAYDLLSNCMVSYMVTDDIA